jgi:hypothetical protein
LIRQMDRDSARARSVLAERPARRSVAAIKSSGC